MRACLWFVGALVIAPLQAQFTGLVTTGDGADLYFSSTLSLKGSGQPSQGRIYEIGSAPLQIAASVPAVVPANPCIGTLCLSSFFDLSQPSVSRDGSLLAYVGTAQCAGLCVNAVDLHKTTVRGLPGKGDLVFSGQAYLSGNGRYLVGYEVSYSEPQSQFYRTDLTTGETSNVALVNGTDGHFPVSGQAVADNGDFVILGGQLNIFQNGQWNPIPPPKDAPNLLDAAIDAAADTVVYQVCCSPYSYLRVIHPVTGQEAVLFHSSGNASKPKLTLDGSQVAFLATGASIAPGILGPAQVYMSSVDGTTVRSVTEEADGIVDFAMSEDGEILWYLSGIGALFQLNVASGEKQLQIPPSCQATAPPEIFPGSATDFGGACLGAATTVTFDGIPGAFISKNANGDGIWVQAPWTVTAPRVVSVAVEWDSPFESLNTTAAAVASAPEFVAGPIHQDWSGLVTMTSPARANEAVSLYALGLGPVQPAVAIGAPGPASPPALVVTPFSCNVPVLFAGLAPGLVGFYQVAIQMPTSGPNLVQVSCTGGAGISVAFQP